MTFARDLVRNTLVRGLWLTLGRRNLVRFSRLLTMESRLDVGNDMATNGETMVQDRVLGGLGLADPPVIFDVGANVGRWTLSLVELATRKRVSGARVYAFEPASATFEKLREQTRATEGVSPVRAALSNENGEAELNVFGAGLGINSLHRPHESRWSGEQPQSTIEKVPLITADTFCHNEKIKEIALLKIDAEGHDFSVLEGARGLLEAHRIHVMQFEYNQRWIDARHFLKDAFDLLQPYGYRIGKITPRGIELYPHWHFELESFREGNYLACLPAHVDLFPQIQWWNLSGPTHS